LKSLLSLAKTSEVGTSGFNNKSTILSAIAVYETDLFFSLLDKKRLLQAFHPVIKTSEKYI
jgi:hypothetical protein